LVLLPNTSYTSGTLIARIADHLKVAEPTFIGGDGWGDWTSSYVGKVKSHYAYVGFRVTPWSIDATDSRTKMFRERFRAVKKTDATGPASLLSYVAVLAPLKAMASRSAPASGSIRVDILSAFRDAVQSTPHFSRPTEYAVYKVTQQGEEYVGSISAVEKKEEP
jgi:ABC-type branched-subunit amino acid transport system substrate-binding protein